MVAYSFQRRFGAPILAGTKSQTIRADRKRHARPGEMVQLFIGMRTKQCQRLGEAPCVLIWPVRLHLTFGAVETNDGWIRSPNELDAFARQDGFQGWDDLLAFWDAEHPGIDAFDGVLIRWRPLAPAAALDLAGAA